MNTYSSRSSLLLTYIHQFVISYTFPPIFICFIVKSIRFPLLLFYCITTFYKKTIRRIYDSFYINPTYFLIFYNDSILSYLLFNLVRLYHTLQSDTDVSCYSYHNLLPQAKSSPYMPKLNLDIFYP